MPRIDDWVGRCLDCSFDLGFLRLEPSVYLSGILMTTGRDFENVFSDGVVALLQR